MEDTLIINALKQGLISRQPEPGLIAHSDRGGSMSPMDCGNYWKYIKSAKA